MGSCTERGKQGCLALLAPSPRAGEERLCHEELGFLHLRLQTWFPFLVQVCVNGREWLSRQMDQAGMAYRREENCFPWIGDVKRAQELMERQHATDWPRVLGKLVEQCHPLHEEISRPIEREYYWTAAQSEYATDVMFRNRGRLERIYPSLVHHAIMSFGAEQVMRYVGRSGRVGINDEVVTDRRRRSVGVRVKHWLNKNSLKFYDKGSVLRDEVTINEPKDFRVWRRAENKPSSKRQWRTLRRSVADFARRAEISRKATDRHLTALAAVEVQSTLAQEAAQVCRAVCREGQRYRPLNPFGRSDSELLAAVNRGEFAINGFRNRDVRTRLYMPTNDKRQQRQQMASVGRKLKLLRAHGFSFFYGFAKPGLPRNSLGVELLGCGARHDAGHVRTLARPLVDDRFDGTQAMAYENEAAIAVLVEVSQSPVEIE